MPVGESRRIEGVGPSGEEPQPGHAPEVSLLALINLVLRHRWTILGWTLAFGLLAAVPAYLRGRTYTSSASFVLQGTDQTRAGLTGLAGQLGLQLSTGGSLSQSPQFYADLLRTHALLGRVADDSFRVEANRAPNVPFVELFDVKGETPAARREAAVRRLLQSIIDVHVAKATGVVGVEATTPWPVVSHAIAADLLQEVNRFSLVMRQDQAAAERRFSESRVEASRTALRTAEDRLAAFLQSNRQYQNSPDLSFAHDRLQREVMLQQQVFTSVVQSYEEARSREARNTPVITVVDSASTPTAPNSRGALPRFVVGALLGAALCFFMLVVRYALLRDRADDPDVAHLRAALADVRRDLVRWIPGGGRAPRKNPEVGTRVDA